MPTTILQVPNRSRVWYKKDNPAAIRTISTTAFQPINAFINAVIAEISILVYSQRTSVDDRYFLALKYAFALNCIDKSLWPERKFKFFKFLFYDFCEYFSSASLSCQPGKKYRSKAQHKEKSAHVRYGCQKRSGGQGRVGAGCSASSYVTMFSAPRPDIFEMMLANFSGPCISISCIWSAFPRLETSRVVSYRRRMRQNSLELSQDLTWRFLSKYRIWIWACSAVSGSCNDSVDGYFSQ